MPILATLEFWISGTFVQSVCKTSVPRVPKASLLFLRTLPISRTPFSHIKTNFPLFLPKTHAARRRTQTNISHRVRRGTPGKWSTNFTGQAYQILGAVPFGQLWRCRVIFNPSKPVSLLGKILVHSLVTFSFFWTSPSLAPAL
jgi:hypothetical protein